MPLEEPAARLTTSGGCSERITTKTACPVAVADFPILASLSEVGEQHPNRSIAAIGRNEPRGQESARSPIVGMRSCGRRPNEPTRLAARGPTERHGG
jgi:hypothetical protein